MARRENNFIYEDILVKQGFDTKEYYNVIYECANCYSTFRLSIRKGIKRPDFFTCEVCECEGSGFPTKDGM